jgi:hypothetical protein
MSEIVENTEDFLEEVYEYILFLASQKYQYARNIIPLNFMGEREFIKVIGEAAPSLQDEGSSTDGMVVIPENNMVDVEITSWLSNTPEGKRESIRDLAEILPDLDEETILEAYGVGNIADVVQRIRTRRREAQAQQLAAQEQEAQIGAPTPAGPQEAIAAIRQLIQGGTPVFPQSPSPEYIQAIDQVIQREGQTGELDEQTLQALQTFRDQVVQAGNRT